MDDVRRCTRCILPETFPNITFNEEGICNYCLTHKDILTTGETELRKILTRKGQKFDCIVPASGGKDSTYILYYAKKKLGLNVLAVHYDAGFQVDLARENLDTACRILDIPLLVVKVDFETQKKLLTARLKMSEVQGNFNGTCCNCLPNIIIAAWNAAKEHKVPYILFGESKFEDGFRNTGVMGYKYLLKNIMPKGIRAVVSFHFQFLKYCYFNILQRNEMKYPLKIRFLPIPKYPKPDHGVEIVYFYDYIEWDAFNKIEFLQNNLGWKFPADHPHRYDCMLHCFTNFLSLKETGISGDGFNYSTMIRQNRLSRSDALKRETDLERGIVEETMKMLEKLELNQYQMPKL